LVGYKFSGGSGANESVEGELVAMVLDPLKQFVFHIVMCD
jgi:hypothetical protein